MPGSHRSQEFIHIRIVMAPGLSQQDETGQQGAHRQLHDDQPVMKRQS
jgi:hypothetical protein